MQVKVSSRHGHVSAQDEAILVEKGTKLQRFLDKVSEILITVDLQHLEEVMVEINVSAEHCPDFVASDKAKTVVSAFDGAMQKMEQQLRKQKEKMTGHKGQGLKHNHGRNDLG
jgi:putative sigma-54 modulation protein